MSLIFGTEEELDETETDLVPPPEQLLSVQLQSSVVQALSRVLAAEDILFTPEDTTPYECDGLTAYRQRPLCVAIPRTTQEVQAVLKVCHALGVPVIARGAGTGLSGGAMPSIKGVTLSMARFNQILDIDLVSRTALVQ